MLYTQPDLLEDPIEAIHEELELLLCCELLDLRSVLHDEHVDIPGCTCPDLHVLRDRLVGLDLLHETCEIHIRAEPLDLLLDLLVDLPLPPSRESEIPL